MSEESNNLQSAVNVPRAPIDLASEGYDGKFYVSRKEPKNGAMRLKLVSDHPFGNTHHLKSQTHTWEGTEAQFRETFNPAESDEATEALAEEEAAIEEIEEKKAAKKAKAKPVPPELSAPGS